MGTAYQRKLVVPAIGSSPHSRFLFKNLGDGDSLQVSPGQYNGIPNEYRILLCAIRLVTDANVANRIAYIKHYFVESGEAFLISNNGSGNIAASTTASFCFGPYRGYYGGSVGGGGAIGFADLVLSGDDYLAFNIYLDEAGDKWDVIILAEYLNYKLGITGL